MSETIAEIKERLDKETAPVWVVHYVLKDCIDDLDLLRSGNGRQEFNSREAAEAFAQDHKHKNRPDYWQPYIRLKPTSDWFEVSIEDAKRMVSLCLRAESYRAMLAELLADWDRYFSEKPHHFDIPEIVKRKEIMERVRAKLESEEK